MNWWAIFAAGLLAGATTCAATQGGLLVGLITRQKKAAAATAATATAHKSAVTAEQVEAMVAARKAQMASKGGGTATKTRPASGKKPAARAAAPKRPTPSAPAPRTVSLSDDLAPVAGFLAGKLLVLTLVGALLGTIGSFITLDTRIGQFAQVLAGVVMVALGLATVGVPGFDRFMFAPPESWTRVVRKSTRSQSAFAPFLLGLATVLIPCGVTISMMLLAATAGSTLAGAAVMFVFVLGTAPLFAAYGYLTQRFVKPDSRRMALVMGSLVIAMGLFTINQFLVAAGSPVTAQNLVASVVGTRPAAAAPAAVAPAPVNGVQTVTINATSGGYEPASIAVKAGVPTKVVFHTDNTRSCIVYTVFPSLGKQVVLPGSGDTEVDLGVLAAGEVPISCSMGMYTGTLVVS
jgi:sulfite exporter TauE/SafE